MKKPLSDTDPLSSPYDAGVAEEDLWFLPPDPDAEDRLDWPLPSEDRRDLLNVVEWRRAEADLAPALARTAQHFGALDERLRRSPVGLRERLAVIEASEISWWCGDRVSTDRLSLYVLPSADGSQVRLVAMLDNLGKGASGAAVQNLNIMAGLDELAGLRS